MIFYCRITSFILRKKTIINKVKIILFFLMSISCFNSPNAYCGKGDGEKQEEKIIKTVRTIQNIPDELLLHIFSFLDFPELLPASEVSHLWRTAAIMGAKRISHITLKPNPPEEKLRAIGQWPIESLEIGKYPIEGIKISQVKLNVRECGVFALTGMFSQLKKLNLGDNKIGDEGVEILAASEALQSLIHLDLYGNKISDQGVKILVNSKLLKSLVFLGLGKNKINGAGLANLGLGELTSLEYLELYLNEINDEGLKALLASGSLRFLTSLQLAENQIGDDGAEALANTDLPSLSALYLDGNKIGDTGIAAISNNISSLTKWNLCRTNITAEGLDALAMSKLKLVFLGLGENRIDDEGVNALIAGDNLSDLTELHLHLNKITHIGLRLLANSRLSKLEKLLISSNNFDPKRREIQEIKETGIFVSIPKLRI